MTIKPSTHADVYEFFEGKMRDNCRAWSVFLDGELVCVSGVCISRTIMVAFSQIKPGLEYNKITAWRAAKYIWEEIQKLGYPVLYAVAAPGLLTAPEFLKRLGFIHKESSIRGEIYRYG